MEKITSRLYYKCLSLWAGVAIGGNLIAAPAKFQVTELTVIELLRVGRAQFAWIGIAEWVLCAFAVLLLVTTRSRFRWAFLIAVSIFVYQQLYLQPILQTRTNELLLGNPVTDSHLHLWFIGAEFLKVALLLWVSLTGKTD